MHNTCRTRYDLLSCKLAALVILAVFWNCSDATLLYRAYDPTTSDLPCAARLEIFRGEIRTFQSGVENATPEFAREMLVFFDEAPMPAFYCMKDFKTNVRMYERLKDLTDVYLDVALSLGRHAKNPIYLDNSRRYLNRYNSQLLAVLDEIIALTAGTNTGH